MDFTAFLATVSNELRIGDTEPTPARPETAALRRSIDAANERIERQRTQLKAAELRRIRAAALERARAAEQRGAATRLQAMWRGRAARRRWARPSSAESPSPAATPASGGADVFFSPSESICASVASTAAGPARLAGVMPLPLAAARTPAAATAPPAASAPTARECAIGVLAGAQRGWRARRALRSRGGLLLAQQQRDVVLEIAALSGGGGGAAAAVGSFERALLAGLRQQGRKQTADLLRLCAAPLPPPPKFGHNLAEMQVVVKAEAAAAAPPPSPSPLPSSAAPPPPPPPPPAALPRPATAGAAPRAFLRRKSHAPRARAVDWTHVASRIDSNAPPRRPVAAVAAPRVTAPPRAPPPRAAARPQTEPTAATKPAAPRRRGGEGGGEAGGGPVRAPVDLFALTDAELAAIVTRPPAAPPPPPPPPDPGADGAANHPYAQVAWGTRRPALAPRLAPNSNSSGTPPPPPPPAAAAAGGKKVAMAAAVPPAPWRRAPTTFTFSTSAEADAAATSASDTEAQAEAAAEEAVAAEAALAAAQAAEVGARWAAEVGGSGAVSADAFTGGGEVAKAERELANARSRVAAATADLAAAERSAEAIAAPPKALGGGRKWKSRAASLRSRVAEEQRGATEVATASAGGWRPIDELQSAWEEQRRQPPPSLLPRPVERVSGVPRLSPTSRVVTAYDDSRYDAMLRDVAARRVAPLADAALHEVAARMVRAAETR